MKKQSQRPHASKLSQFGCLLLLLSACITGEFGSPAAFGDELLDGQKSNVDQSGDTNDDSTATSGTSTKTGSTTTTVSTGNDLSDLPSDDASTQNGDSSAQDSEDLSTSTTQSSEESTSSSQDHSTEHDSDSDSSQEDDSSSSTDTTTSDEVCGKRECRPWEADSCGSGMHCSPYRCAKDGCCTDSTHCMPLAANPKGEGESCMRNGADGNDDCAPQLFCMPNQGLSGGDGPGHCMYLCDPFLSDKSCDGHAPDLAAEQMAVANNQVCLAANLATLPYCASTCDPFKPDCPGGEACYFMGNGFTCLEVPSVSAGTQGDACQQENDCKPGSSCVPHSLTTGCEAQCEDSPLCGCCLTYCEYPGGKCPKDTVCTPAPDVTAYTTSVGMCQPA